MPSNNNNAAIFHVTSRKRWVNWHESFEPQSLHQLIDVWNANPNKASIEDYNATTRGFQDIIARALQENREVRALGGGWSFSNIARTNGILLNTRPLNYRFIITNDQTHPDYNADASNLAFVQCGISVADLNQYLNRLNKSIKTSGASNGQTIVGALSTGTHGSALDVGAIPDFVVGLHIIVSPNKSIWLERASQPVMVNNFPGVIGAELVRNDDLFNAALVSFGSFGVIHGVLLETEDLFFLRSSRVLMPLDEGMWKAIETLNFDDINLPQASNVRPFHFQLLINPYNTNDGVYTTVMYKEKTRGTDCSPPDPPSKLGQGDNALEVVGAITDIASALTPILAGHLVKTVYREYRNVCGTHSEIFTDTTTRGKAASMAIGLSLKNARRAVELAMEAIMKKDAPALLALRYVRASEATLAFTAFRPHTCVLEIDGPRNNLVRNAYKRFWTTLDQEGISYTFHWGKINNLDAQRARTMFGQQKVDAWLNARRTLLTTPALRRVFANEFLRMLQLDE